MWPRSAPSGSGWAHPRTQRTVTVVVALPCGVNSRPVSVLGVPAVEVAVYCDEVISEVPRKSPVPSALNLMKAGPTRSIASRSQRSISTIRQEPAIRGAITSTYRRVWRKVDAQRPPPTRR